jgi:ABC-2 type transport system permease protein
VQPVRGASSRREDNVPLPISGAQAPLRSAVADERRARFAAPGIASLVSEARLYWLLVGMQLRAQTQYKVSLAVDIVSNLLVTTSEFATLLVFFGPFPTLLGWRVGEVALLYAVTSISFGVAELFGAGFDEFPNLIRRGEFDRVLLRPAGALLQIASSDFRLRRLGRITEGVLALLLALHLLPGLRWAPLQLVVLPLGVLSGALIFLAILLLGATLCFWTVETTELTNILTYGGREMLSYPLTVYHPIMQRIFLFVVPLAFGTYIPVCYVLGRPLPFGLPLGVAFVAPLVALVFALLAVCVWRVGVHHYQSTGS